VRNFAGGILSPNGILSAKTPSFILKPKNKAKSGLFGCSKLSENVEKILVLRQNLESNLICRKKIAILYNLYPV